jgi:hypothetical protein
MEPRKPRCRQLRQNGIQIDSSYHAADLGATSGFQRASLNAPIILEGVHEFPVTVFRSPWVSGCKPLEILAVSASETLATLRGLAASGCRDAVLVLHSFSLLKNTGARGWLRSPIRKMVQAVNRLS